MPLEKSQIINKEYKDNKINLLINDCINIEKNIKDINVINENIEKSKNSIEQEIIFNIDEKEIEYFIENIKKFGELNNKINEFEFKLDSNIINLDEFNKINEWVNSNSKVNLKLLYRLTRDGKLPSNFHNKCDNQSPNSNY